MIASDIRMIYRRRWDKMIQNTLANVQLAEHHIYRLGNLLLEATYRRGWTLMVLTENGNHVPRKHGALVAFRLRDDGLWETVRDHATRNFFGWKKWSVVYGEPQIIELEHLERVAASRSAIRETLQDQEVDAKFREIMAAMEW
jgi:hypothetical protein